MAVDKQGNQHCWRCGGQGFAHEHVPSTVDLLGIHAVLTTPRLRCLHCGEYSDIGRPVEYA
jgi:hypothetical protein